MTTNIVVNFQYEATHNWPGVVDHPDLKSVSFLQYPHRHMFHVCAKKEVKHSDRDVEIIKFKRELWEHLRSSYGGELGAMSCEMLAEDLVRRFGLSYCSVLEDGENGAEVYQRYE